MTVGRKLSFKSFSLFRNILNSEENQELIASQLEPMFKRARSQYGSAYNSSMVSSMWAAGKWMAANQTIKQEKGSGGGGNGGGNGGGGGMMGEEPTGGSPVNSPSYPASFTEPAPHTTAVPFTNYDGATNMSSMASNVYAASLNSNSGTFKIDGISQLWTCEISSF